MNLAMLTIKHFFGFIVVCILAPSVLAAPLTRAEVIHAALSSVDVIQAKARLESAQLNARRSSFTVQPVVVSAGAVGSPTQPVAGISAGASVGDVTLSLQLDTLGSLLASIGYSGPNGAPARARSKAEQAVVLAELDLVNTQLRVIRAAVAKWHGLRSAQKALVLSRINLKIMRSNAELAQLGFDAGNINRLSLESAQLTALQAEVEQARSETFFLTQCSRLTLQLLVNCEQIDDVWTEIVAPKTENFDRNSQVIAANGQLADAQLTLVDSRQNNDLSYSVTASYQAVFGTLSASVNSSFNTLASLNTAAGGTASNWSIKFSLSIPLDPQNTQDIAIAERSVQFAKNAVTQARDSVRLEWRSNLRLLDLSKKTLELAQKQYQISLELEKRAQTQLNAGSISSNQFLSVQKDVLVAWQNVISAQANLDDAIFSLYEIVVVLPLEVNV